MIVSPRKIQTDLQSLWPDLDQIWLFDKDYLMPTREEVENFVANNPLDQEAIKQTNPDCDDFALQYHALVKRHFNWSFGEAFANLVGGWSILHNFNICDCQDGVVIVDPKVGLVRFADSKTDNVLWVRM